ncbi:MAG: YIP1 family protein [Limisphaerales bacterium]
MGRYGMITLFKLLVSPFETWTAIAADNRGILRVWLTFVLPLTLVACGFEAWAVHHWGTSTGVGGGIKQVPLELAIRYGFAQFTGLSLAVFVGAFLVQRVEIAFHVNITYRNCFVLVGYSLGPVYAARMLDAIPQLNTWLAWGVGVLLMLGILYNGLPKALKIEAYGAFGMYLFTVLVLVPVTAVAHGAAIFVLTGDVGFGG